MNKQVKNSIDLYKGQPAGTILAALNFQRKSVVNELMEHFSASSKEELAQKLSAL